MAFRYGKVGNESSTDDESQIRPGPSHVTFWSRVYCIALKLRWPSTSLLLLVILAAQVQILHRQPTSLPVGGEINGLVPNFGTTQKKFSKDTRYNSDHKTASSMAATKRNWLALAPRGGGMLEIPTYASHTLPRPMHYNEFLQLKGKDTFVLAAFHQMHCLHHISMTMDSLAMQLHAGNTTVDQYALVHNDHCFDYLRNAIMCMADMTLEGQIEGDGSDGEAGTDGTGAMHVCRNWDEVVRWAEGRRLYDVVHL
ncbi:uncharacterized protein M421DRAFT_95647 [Didymella exigua CBS 183.55]|uniref:Oxidase ustYa n=1 Tax=Didymella exigua CBS 183.55 TaxID=1150837 RepID=A0A6A5R9Z3_9PLEO|nr:uncharacterized protein M421DRAFT_95647 [Didymella exigua CBS 183.55]KAF1924090.1 hypothetical protein M421DRAFT_95647 [Didymella exigua CBS 183.55]